MINIGEYNTLAIIREAQQGLYISDDEGNEVLLPNRYVPENFKIWEQIKVFVYLDNEERPVATTEQPLITKDNFAMLRCNEVSKHGAFLDWGLLKELFCPFKEQVVQMRAGQWYLVRCYLDETTGRLVASSRTNRFLNNSNLNLQKFDEVDLIISHPSEIGMNVIVNEKHSGLIFKDDIFQQLNIGDRLKGYVKNVRPDNKLDIALGKIGYRNIEPNAQTILDTLKSRDGFLPLSDKSSPEDIKIHLEMSKKIFKKAAGNLYKQKLIDIKPDGLYLISE